MVTVNEAGLKDPVPISARMVAEAMGRIAPLGRVRKITIEPHQVLAEKHDQQNGHALLCGTITVYGSEKAP